MNSNKQRKTATSFHLWYRRGFQDNTFVTLQLEGVKKVVSLNSERTRLFNGRRTNVEWTIKINYSGSIPNEGLKFSMISHQQLPFVALNMDDDDNEEHIDDNEEDKADAVWIFFNCLKWNLFHLL